jgi:hypothetical protein
MGRLIDRETKTKEVHDGVKGAVALFINKVRYGNAAAKFWSSLIDEVLEDFPQCSMIELSGLSSVRLEHDLLYPQRALEKDLNRLVLTDMEAMMKETIAELEILGPPSAVNIRLGKGSEELYAGNLSIDCVDADIFPYLIVWPLAWAGIPEATWNKERLEGDFTAEDRTRHLTYAIPFALSINHVSEGLYRRVFTATPSLTAIA